MRSCLFLDIELGICTGASEQEDAVYNMDQLRHSHTKRTETE